MSVLSSSGANAARLRAPGLWVGDFFAQLPACHTHVSFDAAVPKWSPPKRTTPCVAGSGARLPCSRGHGLTFGSHDEDAFANLLHVTPFHTHTSSVRPLESVVPPKRSTPPSAASNAIMVFLRAGGVWAFVWTSL